MRKGGNLALERCERAKVSESRVNKTGLRPQTSQTTSGQRGDRGRGKEGKDGGTSDERGRKDNRRGLK